SGADEQPRRVGQPQVEAPGEGPLQVAEAAADRPVPGAPPGSVVGSGAGDPKRFAGGGGRGAQSLNVATASEATSRMTGRRRTAGISEKGLIASAWRFR